MPNKILHIAGCDKFIPPFVELIKENFDFKQHEFLLTGGMAEKNLIKASNVHLAKRTVAGRLGHYFKALIKMHQADKVILHGLFDKNLVVILFFNPWLLKRCYWAIWGGDLYVHKLGKKNRRWKMNEFFRRPVIRRMGSLISSTEGDVQNVREWYGASGKYYNCLVYTSNLYKEYTLLEKQGSTLNIQVGNSADPSNNHLEALQKLLPYKDENIAIYVPLSYGDQEYASKVIQQGREWFGDKFNPLEKFMPFDKYLQLLSIIDIAIFNHHRQQAMGNITTLLGLGKKVYMNKHVSSYAMLKGKGITVFDLGQGVSFKNLTFEKNKQIIKKEFSKERLIETLSEIIK